MSYTGRHKKEESPAVAIGTDFSFSVTTWQSRSTEANFSFKFLTALTGPTPFPVGIFCVYWNETRMHQSDFIFSPWSKFNIWTRNQLVLRCKFPLTREESEKKERNNNKCISKIATGLDYITYIRGIIKVFSQRESGSWNRNLIGFEQKKPL